MTVTPNRSFDPLKIFPLRLSPFEEYFFVDRHRRYPMTENMIWIFDGKIDSDRLAAAFRRAAASEPLLFAVVKRRFGRLFWTLPSDASAPELTCSATTESIRVITSGSQPVDSFDLTSKPASRFHLVVGPDGFLIHIAIHHSLSDGIGLTRFLGKWFSFYQEETLSGGRSPSIEGDDQPNDPLLLHERENYSIELPEKIGFWEGLRFSLGETFLWFFRRPLNLTPIFRRRKERPSLRPAVETSAAASTPDESFYRPVPDEGPAIEPGRPRLFWRELPVDVAERYLNRAKASRVSVNSLLMRDLLVCLACWTGRSANGSRTRRRIRLLIPASLRHYDPDRLPMSNRLGYVFLDRFPEECDRSEPFLAGIERQMREVQKWSIGISFLDGLRFFRRFPGALRILTARFFCHASLVFSNTGVLCRNLPQPEFQSEATIACRGEFELLRIVGAPPVRPNTPISIGIIAHRKTMVLTFCVDSSVVADADRNELIDEMYDQVCRTASGNDSE